MIINDASSIATLFTGIDLAAVAFLIGSILGVTWLIEHPPRARSSTHRLMRHYRIEWMLEMADRDVRIFDAQVLATLRQGATFFASTTLIAIGGGAAILGQADRVETVASDLDPALSAPLIVWEVKILLAMILLGFAFLKFVWSIRLFGYSAVMMAAMPNDGHSDRARARARRAAEVQVLADRSFTRALRNIYFALAALAWFLGPEALIGAVLLTLGVILRREFASRTRALLLEDQAAHTTRR
ncbi:DUF599 domain-containing protein [Oceanibium sediminis]|uniref:DUF599 domain-containing protein n=1 Tax=Oceanibium sediminis TaxID=2026339 RepID=UPI000DD36A53|nr:DUF599 domain-containing protein [Oceanibium sediminis]